MQYRAVGLSVMFAVFLASCTESEGARAAVPDSAVASKDSLNDSTANVAVRDSTGKLPVNAKVADSPTGSVHTAMQHLNMHIESGIALGIKRLRGTVLSTSKTAPPALNDKKSMIISVESADITIDTTSLAILLNRHVFGYPQSPLRNLHVSIAGNEMVQTGSMKKVVWLKFRMCAAVSLTPTGDIRVHPTAMSVAGIGVKGLSKKLGGLSKLIKLEPGHGARLDGDDIILTLAEMLPPPTIKGRLSSIRIEPGGLRQTFGPADAALTVPERRKGSTATNYMYFHGGTLRFGKLTMTGTDLEIVDADQSNPFDYALDRYQEHLVAGHSNTTIVDGLIVVMPDLQKLKGGK